MKLMIAEKPSVAKELAQIVGASQKQEGFLSGNDYFITWCYGHLIENAMPEEYQENMKKWQIETLPFIPDQWKTHPKEDTKKQFAVIKKLMQDQSVNEIICAGDCGREGELIFRLVYEQAGCKKPVKRLWVSSLEEKELRRGLGELRDASDFDYLYQSALCRSRADWLVGINFSRLYSIRYNTRLSVGRVQTPTVAIIVQRQNEIERFVPQPYWSLVADCSGWNATAKTNSLQEAQAIKDQGHEAEVKSVERQEKESASPRLYSITELQKDANRLLGYTAQQTLTYLQSLYEKKLTTYPRTECQYLPSDMLERLPDLLKSMRELPCIEGVTIGETFEYEKVINDKKLTDHHAIIPTGQKDDNLPEPEKNVLRLVACRFIEAISPSQQFSHTAVTLMIADHEFKAYGKVITRAGYCAVLESLKKLLKIKEKAEAEDLIPKDLQAGGTIPVKVSFKEKKTAPPSPHTDESLLAAMANVSTSIEDADLKSAIKDLGLGTGATRANIIETIIKSGYVEREVITDGKKKKQGVNLYPTENGKKLVKVVADELVSPELTAEWEQQLEQIAAGELSSDSFLNNIQQYVIKTINAAKEGAPEETFQSASSGQKEPFPTIGKCPRCGKKVLEYPKSFACESGRDGCGFTMWKNDSFFANKKVALDTKTAKALLMGKAEMKNLWSEKKEKSYDAAVVLVDTGKYVNFRLDFS